MNDINAAVWGTGTIGACIATLLAGNGLETVVVGHSEEGIARCWKAIKKNLKELESAEKLTEAQSRKILSLLTVTEKYEQISEASVVIEAVAENIEVKRSVYHKIEKVCGAETIIASTTSALPPNILCEDKMKEFLETVVKRQVVRLHKEIEGFIVNRIAQAMFRECLYLVEQGVADATDIDKAIHYAIGMRYASIGLLEYFDAVGFSLEKDIAKTIYPTLCNESEIQKIVLRGLESGKTGIEAGEGLYQWNEKCIQNFNARKGAPYLAAFNWNLPEE